MRKTKSALILSLVCASVGGLFPLQAANSRPTLSLIANQTVNEDTFAGPLPFAVGDLETPASALIVAAGSSNPTLIPAANIIFGGSGSNRTVQVKPATNQFGTAAITITVSDADGGRASA